MKLLCLVAIFLVTIAIGPSYGTGQTRFVCYFLSNSRYRTGSGGITQFTTSNIDANLCTHLLYSFAVLDGENYKIQVQDTRADIYNKGYEKCVALKKRNPNLKVMIVMGGVNDVKSDTMGGESKGKYSKMVENYKNIATFVASAVAFLQKYHFDGMDLDWRPTSVEDATGFTNLVVELRKAFRAFGFVLSATCNQFKSAIDVGDVSRLNEHLDFLNVWTMGFYNSYSEPDSADHPAPLRKRTWDIHEWYVDFAINYWISKGISPNKIVLGIPLYGTSWTLTSDEIAPPALAAGAGAPGKFLKKAGMMAYYEICDAVRSDGWTVVHDPSEVMGPYAVSPLNNPNKTWVGYDDPATAVVKSKYILSKGLGGAFVWSIDLDDFRNICGGGVNPILTAITKSLKIFVSPSTTTTAVSVENSSTTKQLIITTISKSIESTRAARYQTDSPNGGTIFVDSSKGSFEEIEPVPTNPCTTVFLSETITETPSGFCECVCE